MSRTPYHRLRTPDRYLLQKGCPPGAEKMTRLASISFHVFSPQLGHIFFPPVWYCFLRCSARQRRKVSLHVINRQCLLVQAMWIICIIGLRIYISQTNNVRVFSFWFCDKNLIHPQNDQILFALLSHKKLNKYTEQG